MPEISTKGWEEFDKVVSEYSELTLSFKVTLSSNCIVICNYFIDSVEGAHLQLQDLFNINIMVQEVLHILLLVE